jgi:hypothetical protein
LVVPHEGLQGDVRASRQGPLPLRCWLLPLRGWKEGHEVLRPRRACASATLIVSHEGSRVGCCQGAEVLCDGVLVVPREGLQADGARGFSVRKVAL